MCTVLQQLCADHPEAIAAADPATRTPRLRRRTALLGSVGGAALAGLAAAPGAAAQPAGRGRPRRRTELVLLGTAGGPSAYGEGRMGISTMVLYNGKAYVVDLGHAAQVQLARSGIAPSGQMLSAVRGIFFTHMHSDHVPEWPALYATSYWNTNRQSPTRTRIKVFGPGDRQTLPAVFPAGRPAPPLVNPENPMPGITSMTGYLDQAFAADFNDRMRDNNQPALSTIFELHDIDVSQWWAVDAKGVPPVLPAGTRIPVVVDGDVRVTATLADHHPTAPAFAYRFDTPDGSVVVSGDTTVHPNVVDLARGADYLVHEVIDAAWVERVTAALPDAVREGTRQHLLGAHTTIDQVGQVAERAGVKNLVLNHLVPANNPEHLWKRASRSFSGKLYVGRDLDRFGMGPRI